MLRQFRFKPLTYEDYIFKKWHDWIENFFFMVDNEGNFIHYPNSGGLYEQDWKHMEIYSVIKREYIKEMGREK